MKNNTEKAAKPISFKDIKAKFAPKELVMLEKIYNDLAGRSVNRLTKDSFLQFFNLSGLIGDRLFNAFDKKRLGCLTYEEFITGLATCCKDTEEAKVKFLFSLYDVNGDGLIEKNQVLESIYTHSKEQIRSMLNDIFAEKKKKHYQVTEEQRKKLIDSQSAQEGRESLDDSLSDLSDSSFDDDTVIPDEDKNFEHFSVIERDIRRAFEFYLELEEARKKIRSLYDSDKKQTSVVVDSKVKSEAKKHQRYQSSGKKSIFDDTRITDKRDTIVVESRISRLSDRSFIGGLSFENFAAWMKKHSLLLDVFNNTFHEEVWGVKKSKQEKEIEEVIEIKEEKEKEQSPEDKNLDFQTSAHVTEVNEDKKDEKSKGKKKEKQDKKQKKEAKENAKIEKQQLKEKKKEEKNPKLGFQTQQPDKAGFLYKKEGALGLWKKRYFEVRDQFLFYYNKKQKELPKGVIYLEGCYIEELNDEKATNKYGFKLGYLNEATVEFLLYCDKKEEKDEWVRFLNDFINFPKHNKHSFKESINNGKSSFIYRPNNKTSNGSDYAVEVIDKTTLTSELKEQIRSSISIIKALNHPNIAKLVEFVETSGYMYIATEDCKDGDLFSYVLSKGCLDEKEASIVMKQLFEVISYVHEVGFVHRNIKPENILISLGEDNCIKQIKLTNFVNAKLNFGDEPLVETCGTPNFIAPEVLKGTGYNHKIDEWGLGVTMYFMLQGCLPFDAENSDAILKNVLRKRISEEDFWASISLPAKDLLKRLLQKNPEKRIHARRALKHTWINVAIEVVKLAKTKTQEFDAPCYKEDYLTSVCNDNTHYKSVLEIPVAH